MCLYLNHGRVLYHAPDGTRTLAKSAKMYTQYIKQLTNMYDRVYTVVNCQIMGKQHEMHGQMPSPSYHMITTVKRFELGLPSNTLHI